MNSTSKTPTEVRALEIRLYDRDQFFAKLTNSDGTELAKYEGNIRGYSSDQRRNNYLTLNVNVNAHQIAHLRKPTCEQIAIFTAQAVQLISPISQFDLAKLKLKLRLFEEKIAWKWQEIETMQKEVEHLYLELEQWEGEAA